MGSYGSKINALAARKARGTATEVGTVRGQASLADGAGAAPSPGSNLRDLASGQLYFMIGHSKIGGPDVIR